MKELFEQKPLSKEKLQQLLQNILQQPYNQSQKAVMLAALEWQGWQQETMEGMYDFFRMEGRQMDLSAYGSCYDWISIQSDTFLPSISLAISFIAAGSGLHISKTGDYGYGKNKVGYSDVIEYLGIPFCKNALDAGEQLDKANFCYLHLPDFYPSIDDFDLVRKDLNIPTILDGLLPLLHPVENTNYIIGSAQHQQLNFYQYWFQEYAHTYGLLHDFSGTGEISLTHSFKWIKNGHAETLELADWKLPKIAASIFEQKYSTPLREARRLERILTEKGTDEENFVVLTNTALLLHLANPKLTIQGALAEAEATLFSGRALKSLNALLSF